MTIDAPRNPIFQRKIRNTLININKDTFRILELSKQVNNSDDFSMLEYYVITLEDRRFLNHSGFDVKSVIRNIWKMVRFEKYGGSSTIDMQMVRTITGFKDRTFYRKIYEIILAYIINHKLSKKQIIRIYLQNAFLGSQIYGIKSASLKMFNKKPEHLTEDESARIAAMLLRPKPLRANDTWLKSSLLRASYAQHTWISIKHRFK